MIRSENAPHYSGVYEETQILDDIGSMIRRENKGGGADPPPPCSHIQMHRSTEFREWIKEWEHDKVFKRTRQLLEEQENAASLQKTGVSKPGLRRQKTSTFSGVAVVTATELAKRKTNILFDMFGKKSKGDHIDQNDCREMVRYLKHDSLFFYVCCVYYLYIQKIDGCISVFSRKDTSCRYLTIKV